MNQISSLWLHDLNLLKKFPLIAGVDEAGRGPLAGNVVAAAVVLDFNCSVLEVNDSKKLPEKKREQIFDQLPSFTLYCGTGECSPEEIDKLNILNASLLAMKRALEACGCKPDLVLVDGNKAIPNLPFTQRTIVKGDGLSASIAAASILAKVTRDRQMLKLHNLYPHYNFACNKGYPTKDHINAILEHGYTPFHRRSFKPKALTQLDIFNT